VASRRCIGPARAHGSAHTVARPLSIALLATALGLVAACNTMMPNSAPKPMVPIEETVENSATVEKIDLDRRIVALKNPSGELVAMHVDAAVQNLSQVKVGDRVVVRYREAIAAAISKTAEGQPVTVVDLAAERAGPGELPSAIASSTTNVPVTITAVDTKHNIVSFYREDGLVRALKAKEPQAQEFLKQLTPGDTVVVSFTEAIAISVEPAK
jgi:hypothetical protein